MQRYQQPLSRDVSLDGLDIFSGEQHRVTFSPATRGGIQFMYRGFTIPARLENAYHHVVGPLSCVGLRNGGEEQVWKVEHVLPDLMYGLGLDHVLIHLERPMMPRFTSVNTLLETLRPNLAQLNGWREYLCLKSTTIPGASARSEIGPAALSIHSNGNEHPRVTYVVGSEERGIPLEEVSLTTKEYAAEFGEVCGLLLADRYTNEQIREHGPGLTMKNTLILRGGVATNPDGERYDGTELVRHKARDLLGVAALLGAPLWGVHLLANRCGHEFDLKTFQEWERASLFFPFTTRPRAAWLRGGRDRVSP